MSDFFHRRSPKAPPGSQPLNPNQGLRRLHAPPLLPNSKGKLAPPPILSDAPIKLPLPNRQSPRRKQFTEEELTVTNLRQIYSSLLEELAPLHHEIGTGGADANYRWKNSGTVTVNGSEDEGYDYSYTPDNSKKSWRLQRGAPGGAGGGGGITGGDWSKDGIRRYYTGGALERGGGGHSSNVINVGGLDVDVGTMDGVALSPTREATKADFADEGELVLDPPALDHNFSIDDEDDAVEGKSSAANANEMADATKGDDDDFQDVDIAGSGHSTPDAETAPGSTPSGNECDNSSSLQNDKGNMTTFESMYHLSPTMAWRLRSAYSPKTPQEQHLNFVGSEILAQRHPAKADGIMKGLEVARNCESRVCDGLRKLGELISYCERLKGVKYASQSGKLHRREEGEEETSSEEEEEDLEAAEAIFAYFCEKNVLPMLIDSLLCHPPPLTSSPTDVDSTDNMLLPANTTTIGSSPSPFSGVAWTSAVKAQILQTIAMILFNTSSPLSLTYLLSNNYMNELIMGLLPLDQWKDDALEDILPPYITLLRGIVMRLRGEEGSSCLPLFLCQRHRQPGGNSSDDEDSTSTETYLPLLYAAVQVFCSPFGTSLRDSEGCLIRTTAMNVVLNLCRIADPEIRLVLVQGGRDSLKESLLPTTKSAPTMAPSSSMLSRPLTIEQELLFPHICKSLNSWYHRSVRLALVSLSMDNKKHHHEDAKAEAKARHRDMAETAFRELQHWMGFIDDLLSCEIRAWNIRLVEWLLREVVVGTVLLRWNRSLGVIGAASNDDGSKVSSEVLKARAEARVSMIFLTQLFGMIEYSPLIRLVGTLVLHQKYPDSWQTDFGKEDGLFVVTSTINAMISKQPSTKSGEEADAGAGGQPSAIVDAAESIQQQSADQGTEKRASLSDRSGGEMNHRAMETLAARLDFHQLADEVEQRFDGKHFTQNRHRAALLEMLAGNAHSKEETLLASMLLATMLENDAIDDAALEVFGVLPSPTGDSIQLSPFETSLAQFLSGVDCSDTHSYATLECVSSLGLMLLERLIGHTWTEGGQCVDAVPFDHFYKSSKLIQALGARLTQFAALAESHLGETSVTHEIVSDSVRQRFSGPGDVDAGSPRSHEEPKMFSSVETYYPSNFIDDPSVLVEVQYGGICNDSPSSGDDLFLVNEETEAARFAIRSVLHLRSIVGCIQDLYRRVTAGSGSIIDSHWHGEDDLLSLRTTEEADDILLAIGGVQTTQLPEVGTDIDLRGRKSFSCFLPRKPKFGKNIEYDIVIDANGTRFVVTEKAELVLVVDPSEMYVAKVKKRDLHRCTVLSVIPHRSIVASGAEGELLRIVTNSEEIPPGTTEFIRNGTLSLRFQNNKACQTAKECLDKHCSANENKNIRDLTELLEQCKSMGEISRAAPQDGEVEADAWCDFQG